MDDLQRRFELLDAAARKMMGYVCHQVGCLHNSMQGHEYGACTCGLDEAILMHMEATEGELLNTKDTKEHEGRTKMGEIVG
jgi:hypothetical protein